MNENKEVRIGIIGVGGIAMGAHVSGLNEAKNCRIVAICDIDEEKLKTRGDQLGIPQNMRFKNYKELIDCPEVDAAEVCTPNFLHPEMAAYSIEKGKPVNIEKPLGISYEQAKIILEAQKKYGTPAMVCFSYRFKSAVRYAKKLLSENAIGEILGVNVRYLKDSGLWAGRKLEWRFEKQYAGTGVLGDLGVHLIDMCTYLIGNIKKVCGTCDIIVKERPLLCGNGMGTVTTDDACNFIAVLENGKTANFSISRCVLGHKNTITFDIYGSKGIISFDLNTPEKLGVCVGNVDLECGALHFVDVPSKYSLSQEQTFADIAAGKAVECYPTVEDGLRCQRILDAVLESSQRGITVEI